MAAQFIANNEAAKAERDQLCAEVERLTARESNQSERIRYLEGATNHATGTPLSQAMARAERAEAELAKERARLDYLSTLGFEHRHHETGDHLGHEWTISSYGESEDVTLRDVIDAEMREDAK
jgi:alkyl sulfatase BDS1-like metallo-beta-lactamase superfamily hydrolase